MAEISGQQGASLTNELAQYLQNADGEINSSDLAGIINEYLSGGDQLNNEGTSAASGIYKKFNEFRMLKRINAKYIGFLQYAKILMLRILQLKIIR